MLGFSRFRLLGAVTLSSLLLFPATMSSANENDMPYCVVHPNGERTCRRIAREDNPNAVDFLFTERELIDIANSHGANSFVEACGAVIRGWTRGVEKDWYLFQYAETGDIKAMALIRNRYPLFFYSFATEWERVTAVSAVDRLGLGGIHDAYAVGFREPAEADSVQEVWNKK